MEYRKLYSRRRPNLKSNECGCSKPPCTECEISRNSKTGFQRRPNKNISNECQRANAHCTYCKLCRNCNPFWNAGMLCFFSFLECRTTEDGSSADAPEMHCKIHSNRIISKVQIFQLVYFEYRTPPKGCPGASPVLWGLPRASFLRSVVFQCALETHQRRELKRTIITPPASSNWVASSISALLSPSVHEGQPSVSFFDTA